MKAANAAVRSSGMLRAVGTSLAIAALRPLSSAGSSAAGGPVVLMGRVLKMSGFNIVQQRSVVLLCASSQTGDGVYV